MKGTKRTTRSEKYSIICFVVDKHNRLTSKCRVVSYAYTVYARAEILMIVYRPIGAADKYPVRTMSDSILSYIFFHNIIYTYVIEQTSSAYKYCSIYYKRTNIEVSSG